MYLQHLKRYPLKQMIQPKGGLFKIYENYYWIVDTANNLLNYKGIAWQCNQNENVVTSLRDKCYPEYTIKKLNFVFTPFEINDY